MAQGGSMATYPLTTQLQVPPLPYRPVRRVRLVNSLERGIPRHKLTLLCAPAGYGKTTALSQWARSSGLPLVWLSLSEQDNDFEGFFRYLLKGWQALWPSVAESPLGLLLEGTQPPLEAISAAFVNVADDAPSPPVFVFDDYQLIENPAIHQTLGFLLEHLPPNVHIVLASRSEPLLPLARYRARRELLEVGTDDLEFSLDETRAFFRGRSGCRFSPDELTALHAQLEGWVAGLQLALLAFKHRRGAGAIPAPSGRHRFIADYLHEDVLARQPEAVRRFLLQTSILAQLCGPLCAAVTGGENAQDMLERLERDNLFLTPLDDDRTWFRYHQLFARVLYEELERRHPADVTELHSRAARWHLEHELPDEALRHAVAANDFDLGVEVVEGYFEAKLLSGEFKLLTRWLESLPGAWYTDYPSIGLIRAGVFLFSGAFERGIRCVDEVEQALGTTESEAARWHLARTTAIRCAIACFQNDLTQAESYAEQALQALPVADHAYRAVTFHALGDSYRRNGFWVKARRAYLEVLELTRAPSFRIRSVHVLGGLADLELRQGRLRAAAACWEKALGTLEGEPRGSFPLPLTGWLYIRLSEVRYAWNELDEATDSLAKGLERAELGGDARVLIAGYLNAARLNLTLGELGGAGAYLERARALVANAPDPEWQGRVERVQLELWLAQGKLRAAVLWLDAQDADVPLDIPLTGGAQLAQARVLLVKGDATSLERALKLLKPLVAAVEAEGRSDILIEALALLALTRWQRGDTSGALTALERALRLAEPEGYVRLFVDLGLPLARLLQAAQARAVLPEYLETLLAAFTDRSTPTVTTGALPQPLTRREQEVLELLAAGLTNRETAAQLDISSETVKKHVGNLFAKLTVRTRTEAVAKARALDLLG